MGSALYIFYPAQSTYHGIAEIVADVVKTLRSEPSWSDWEMLAQEYDDQQNFDASRAVQRAINRPGPLILVGKPNSRAREIVREKLRYKSVVEICENIEATDIWATILTARERFLSGEPFLPAKYVAAVLLVRKLERGHFWGGKSKGFMWFDDLARGRGVDEQFRNIMPAVVSELLTHGILIKKTSGGGSKWALNPDKKSSIFRIVDDGVVVDQGLLAILMRDLNTVSARMLERAPPAGLPVDPKEHSLVVLSLNPLPESLPADEPGSSVAEKKPEGLPS